MRFERVRDPQSSILDPQAISHTQWKSKGNAELYRG